MLTIGKLGVSRDRLEYYEAQVAAGAEDYYAGRGESPGRWRGSGARALGLAVGGQPVDVQCDGIGSGFNPDNLFHRVGMHGRRALRKLVNPHRF